MVSATVRAARCINRRGDNRSCERTCESCYGSALEKISPELKGKMNAELAGYIYPKLRSIEHSGEDGGPLMPPIIRVVYVDSPAQE